MASLDLTLLSGSTYVARGPTNVGVFAAGDGRAVLIDSGNDDDAGRKILRACEAAGLHVSHIANTHSNADHCGGNAFIQARTNCRIAAPRQEAVFIENPALEPSFLWGGFPLPPLRNKFLMAKSSRVTDLLEAPCSVPGAGIDALPLPGHYIGMVGFMTPDKVFFAADSAASPEILIKYSYYFVYDVAAHLASLDALNGIAADWIVPSHADPTHDAGPLVAANKAKILEVGEKILDLCAEASTPETLVARLADGYGLELNHTQYALIGSTLRSYIAWLADKGLVVSRLEANRIIIERK
ncbi:MAG: MBL fold metallo-hydrolase [Rectinemataceae bacterium]|jgi:glyoxylase-like metal-dependent hydrolase (beta-lactamase superfamily II)